MQPKKTTMKTLAEKAWGVSHSISGADGQASSSPPSAARAGGVSTLLSARPAAQTISAAAVARRGGRLREARRCRRREGLR